MCGSRSRGYPGMAAGLAAAQVRAVPVPIDASGFSPDAAIAMAPNARLAVVAPSHQFPLGAVLTLQRRLALLSWAERTQGWIAEDDFDGEYRYSGRPLAPLRALDRSGRVAYLGSFSKLLFPALRLSFLVLPASLVDATERVLLAVSTPARCSARVRWRGSLRTATSQRICAARGCSMPGGSKH